MERKQSYQPRELQSCEPDIPTGVRLALNDSKVKYNDQAAQYFVGTLSISLSRAQTLLGLPWEKMRCEDAYAALQIQADRKRFLSGEEVEVFKEITEIAGKFQNERLQKREIENLFKNAVRYLADGNKPRKIISVIDASKNFMTRPPGKGREVQNPVSSRRKT